ncbi:MAG: hypothetical protein J6S85_20080 [Methanobrevibacter sp.]|nr:hypothetical protein [Methanobrevibacter sp.]
MVVEIANDIITDETHCYSDNDRALILTQFELERLEIVLHDYVVNHSVIQDPVAANTLQVIKEFLKEQGENK